MNITHLVKYKPHFPSPFLIFNVQTGITTCEDGTGPTIRDLAHFCRPSLNRAVLIHNSWTQMRREAPRILP